LGKRLGEALKVVAQKIKELNPFEIDAFVRNGSMIIEGHTLDSSDVNAVRFFDSQEQQNLEALGDKDLVVIVNCDVSDSSLFYEGLSREIVNKVQRLRKEAHLNALDDVITYYKASADSEEQMKKALESTQEFLVKSLRRTILPLQEFDSQKLIVQKEFEVKGSTFVIYLVWP